MNLLVYGLCCLDNVCASTPGETSTLVDVDVDVLA